MSYGTVKRAMLQPTTARSIWSENLAEEKLEGFFSIKIRNLRLWKVPKLIFWGFQREIFFKLR